MNMFLIETIIYNPMKDTENETNYLETYKEAIITSFFETPEEVATIFRYWLSEENNGAVKAAHVIIATDKHLLRTLKRELHPEDYELISDQLNEIIPMSIDQRNELIIEFGSMLH